MFWKLTPADLRWLVFLATLVILVAVWLVVRNPEVRPASPLQPKQTGQGVADHATIIHEWANAARRRDYEAVRWLMPIAADWAFAYWRERNETQLANGWIDTYTVEIQQQGEVTTAIVRWTGQGPKEVCTTVQVNRQGALSVVKEYAWCPD